MSGAVLFGSYELLDRIAEGGMAEVWRARSRGVAGFEKTVVIKRVLPSLMANVGFAGLLVREAKIAALLSHPNIVQIFDLGEEGGAYFIAMEHVPGKDLGQVMTLGSGGARGGLSLPLELWIVAEVAKALDYAHRRRGPDGRPLNIVHRDISPQNVLLGFEGAVKVADFGIARADQSELGKGDDPKVLRGKYAYMSPEQARGEPLDRRSDLFSLGIVMYELLTSLRLFRGRSSGETLELVRKADVPPLPAELGLPEQVEKILRRALARDRDERYGSAGELCTDLGKVLFDLGAHVDEADLAEAMARMFPQDGTRNPNKLDVDLMLRAYDDATALSNPGREADATPNRDRSAGTRAFPTSRRLRAETRRVVLLVAEERDGDEEVFESAVRNLGGAPLRVAEGLREAVFGHAAFAERAAEHAARAALELSRRLALGPRARGKQLPVIGVLPTRALVLEEEGVEPEPEARVRAAEIVRGRWPGEIRVADELVEALSRTFSFTEGNPPVLEGYRSPHERESLVLRRRGPLVGRREEMQLLSAALAQVAAGSGRAFLVVGEPGSGKSRLAAELSAIAVAQGVVVVRGGGDEAEAALHYGALADIFRDLCGLAEVDTPQERFAKVDRLRVLGLPGRQVRTVGELLGLAYPLPPERRLGRPRGIELLSATRRALRALATEGPILLVLEDLHWMDDPTRQLLPLLLRGLAPARVMTVMTARPGSALPHFDATAVSLGPLPIASARRLFAFGVGARAVEDELASRLMEETHGNPSWIESMAASVAERPDLTVEGGVAALPAPVEVGPSDDERALVAARIAQLPPDQRDLVRAAAVFEHGVDVRTLAELRAVPLDVAEPPIRRLLVHRLLVPTEARDEPALPGPRLWGGGRDEPALPPRVYVPGAMLRRAIREGLSESDLRRLHGRVVAVLERGSLDDPERLGELAFHAARSADRRRAPDYLIQAAEAAQRAGDVRVAATRFAEAARISRELHGSAHDPDELFLRASEMALEAADAELAERVLAELAGSSRSDDTMKVRLAIARARAAMRRDAFPDAVLAAAEASSAIDAVGDAVLRARALFEWGRAEIEVGRPERGAELLDRAQSAAGEDEPAVRGRALCAFAVALARANRLDEADHAVSAALAVTARLGTGELRHLSLAAMAEAQAARGALAGAAARWAEAAEVAAQLGAFEEAARLDALAAAAWVEAGDEQRAVPIAERAVRAGRTFCVESAALLATAVQGALAVAAHPDPVWVPKLRQAVDRLEQLGRYGEAAHAVLMLARAHRALADPGAESRMRERAAELAEAGGHRAMAERLRHRPA